MTTGYVFRVENEATVLYLQQVGRPGHLTTLKVTNRDRNVSFLGRLGRSFYDTEGSTFVSEVAYLGAVATTWISGILLVGLKDWWGVAFLTLLVFVRLVNVLILRRRATNDWHGEPEPGVRSDLIVLLSQDRWIRASIEEEYEGGSDPANRSTVSSVSYLICKRNRRKVDLADFCGKLLEFCHGSPSFEQC
jgi:hypothetical protein